MKRLNSLAITCFTLALFFVVTGVSHAVVTECYDISGFCNSIKVIYTDGNINQGGGVTHVFGREYGCGAVDRAFTGIIKTTATDKHIIVTGFWNPTSLAQIGGIHIDLNNSARTSGPGQYTYISGASNPASTIYSNSATYTKVVCPASSNGPLQESMTPGPDVTLGR